MAMRTLRRAPSGFGYVSSDGRFEVTPAYESSIRGGSVRRPSHWVIKDFTGQLKTCDRSLLADARAYVRNAPGTGSQP
jgi:hypothetical protein